MHYVLGTGRVRRDELLFGADGCKCHASHSALILLF